MESFFDVILAPLLMLMPCGFMFLYMAFILLVWFMIIAVVVLWIWMLVDVAQRKVDEFPNKSENDRMVWIVIVALANWIGGIIYYFAVYRKYPRKK